MMTNIAVAESAVTQHLKFWLCKSHFSPNTTGLDQVFLLPASSRCAILAVVNTTGICLTAQAIKEYNEILIKCIYLSVSPPTHLLPGLSSNV